MKKKGFTLVELLVVIAIIALLMGILMPALAKVRQIAYRLICGTNLSGIGKTMLTYANDYEGELPRLGGPKAIWATSGTIANWEGERQNSGGSNTPAFGAIGSNQATISASLFYLARAYDTGVGQFVCRADTGTKAFKLTDFTKAVAQSTADLWDFGDGRTYYSGAFCSYSYHMPYMDSARTVSYNLNSSCDPASPVCADRSPYLDKNAVGIIPNGTSTSDGKECPTATTASGVTTYADEDKLGNAISHQQDGQNVLYLDTHVAFEKTPIVGINSDNIYKYWESYTSTSPKEPTDIEKQVGQTQQCLSMSPAKSGSATTGTTYPRSLRDAFLVNELQVKGPIKYQ